MEGTSGLLARVELDKDRSCGRGGTERCPCGRRLPGAGNARARRSQILPKRRPAAHAARRQLGRLGVGRWDGGGGEDGGGGGGRSNSSEALRGGSWSPRGPSPASPTSRGESGSLAPAKAEPSLQRVRAGGRGRGPAPAARPFPSRLPLPPKRSGAGPDPLAQEGCRAGSASSRLLAAGCGPAAAGRRRTKLRAESGAAPPPFRPNAGGLLPGSTASRDRGPALRGSRPRGADPRVAAPPGRSGGTRGSRAQGAPCTPRALRCSGRSRRSSLLARLPPPPPPPPPERPPHPLLPPPPRPPRRSGLGSQRRAAASAPGRAAAPASAPRWHPQARPCEAPGTVGAPAPLPHLKFSPRPLPPWRLEPRPACGPFAGPGCRAVLPRPLLGFLRP
ncbi:uncharacterized protein AAG666_014169 [Megaptera novaeangliae]